MIKKDKCMVAYENKIKRFADQVKGRRILDVGCGTGDYTSMFSHDRNEVIGVDINDFRQKKFVKKFDFIKYDGKKLPFTNQEFDVVVSFDVIEHVENDLFFLNEIHRVLKKNGEVFLATPNRTRFSNMLMKIAGKPVRYPYVLSEDSRLGEVIHLREYISGELKILFQKINFREVGVESFWFGLRGRANRGLNSPVIKSLAQYLFVSAKK
ncbi:MAG: class I SAM-dependent methyltransferase [Candidatus Berkelbacteria bacterium]|nr:class I SAM-dependent methyltransferase [Candidatus Berkelbacteria bacterium]